MNALSIVSSASFFVVAAAAAVAGDPASLASYAAHVGAAEASLRLGEVAAARHWLDGAPKEHRGFEWRYLDARLDEATFGFTASEVALFGLDVSNDGSMVAIGDAKGRVRVFELADGREVFAAHEHTDLVDDVRFDASSKRLVSASHDRTVRVWDLATQQCTFVQKDHRFPVGGAAFTPDGGRVLSANYERDWNGKRISGVVRLWNPDDGVIEATFDGGAKPLTALALSPDGKRFAAASWDFCAFAWDIAAPDDQPVRFIQPDEELYNAVDCVAWSPDGTRLAYGGKDHTVRLHDARTRELLVTLREHGDDVTGVAFSPDGSRIATTCADGVVRIFDAAAGSLVTAMRGHTSSATCVEFTPDGARVVTAGADGRVLVFDATHANYGEIRPKVSAAAYCTRFSPDGTLLATCTFDGKVQLFDARTFALRAEWQAHAPEKCAITLAFADAGKELLSCSYDGTIRRWNVATHEEIGRIDFPAGVYTFALADDGALIAAALMNRTIVLRDRESGDVRLELPAAGGIVYTLAFDRSGRHLLAGGQDRRLRIYDVASGSLLRTIEHPTGAVQTVAFTPDEAHCVTGSDDGTIKEWNVATGALVRTVFETNHTVQRLTFTPDGSRLVAVGVRVWVLEASSGTLLVTLHAPADEAFDLAIDGDGALLATANMDGSVSFLSARALRARK